jgi:hypothetical protein
MAVSKGKHVDSSRTSHSHYSKNPSDLGREDQEKQTETIDRQNSSNSHSYLDELEAMREAARREEQAFVEAQRRSRPIEPAEPAPPEDHPDYADLDALLADLDMSGTNVETAEEVIAEMSPDDLDEIEEMSENVPASTSDKASKTILDHATSPPERSESVSDGARDRSKNVSNRGSKKVSARQRRSPANDARIIASMRDFVPSDASPAGISSFSYPSPSLPHPSTSTSTSTKAVTPPTPANDNRIPVWSLTGDAVTAVCATTALLIAEKPAVAFTFNLTPDAIADAKRDPAGFLDPLKRRFDRELKQLGLSLPYWFAIDIDDDGRPHIHGAFLPPAISLSMLRKIRGLMKNGWGKWEGPGKHKQVRFQTLYSDDWATYCIRNRRKVQKAIGPRSFTITQPLGRDARWVYGEIRRIMREDEVKFFWATM